MIGRQLLDRPRIIAPELIQLRKVCNVPVPQHLCKLDKYLRRSPGIIHRPVVIFKRDMKSARDHVQLKLGQCRKQDPRHRNRIHRSEIRHNVLISTVLLYKSHIKGSIVGHQHCVSNEFQKLRQNRLYIRCLQHHLVRDTGKLSDLKRNRHPGIHESTVSVCDLPLLHLHRTDLDDLILDRAEPCRLKIEHHKGTVQRLPLLIDRHIRQVVHQIAFHPVDHLKRIVLIKPLYEMVRVCERLYHTMIRDGKRLMPPVVGAF